MRHPGYNMCTPRLALQNSNLAPFLCVEASLTVPNCDNSGWVWIFQFVHITVLCNKSSHASNSIIMHAGSDQDSASKAAIPVEFLKMG